MQTILFPCPDQACGEQHALCWLVGKRTKRLGVNCGLNRPAGHTTFKPIEKAKLDVMDDSGLDDIPVHYTPEARSQEADRQGMQFTLMNVQLGEQMERSAPKCMEEQRMIGKLQAKINEYVAEQKRLTGLIENLAKQRIEAENKERETRAKLRELWTEPLDLK